MLYIKAGKILDTSKTGHGNVANFVLNKWLVFLQFKVVNGYCLLKWEDYKQQLSWNV